MAESHPKGLYLLFTVEMWERFSYYGMRAILVLFMTKYFMFDTEKAGQIYGLFTGFVYLTPLIGGYIADKYLGARKCIFIGGILMALGQFSLASQNLSFFYVGLGLLIAGNGFFKSNISTVVGMLYKKNDSRRDGGFTIFYMGINLGAFMSPLICGTLGEKIGWQWGFFAAGVGMIIGTITLKWGERKFLGDKGLKPVTAKVDSTGKKSDTPLTKEEKHRIAVIFIMAFFVIFFWAAFEQAGSSLTLFTDQSTNRYISFLDFEVPASYFQSVNPLLIFILAPMFSRLWTALSNKKIEPSTPAKFVYGLVLLALGFLLMIGAVANYEASGAVSMLWLVGVYLFHTLGELCLSPVGLSMVTKLSPARFASMLMGVWMAAVFFSNLVAGLFAGNYDQMDKKLFFMIPLITAVSAAIVLLLLLKPIKRWMHGIW